MKGDGVGKSSLSSRCWRKNKHDLSVGRCDPKGVLGFHDTHSDGNQGKQKGDPKGEHSLSGSNGITKVDLAPTRGACCSSISDLLAEPRLCRIARRFDPSLQALRS